MPIMRNPFRRQDENVVPAQEKAVAPNHINIKEPTEYKLSEISDSGVYLPPSPPERNKTFWTSRSNTSTTTSSSNHRSVLSENEPFNISRESFDSYRRSFDICARSPIIPPETRPRASLDARFVPQSRNSATFTRLPEPTQEEEYEDVGLNDEASKPKKRGFFSRGESHSDGRSSSNPSGRQGFHIGGRKRGQSGTGQELGEINRNSHE